MRFCRASAKSRKFSSTNYCPGSSCRRIVKSTVVSVVAAAALLVTVVMPPEYGIDPTGIGSVMGLTEMVEIKTQRAEEPEFDRKATQNAGESLIPAQPAPILRVGTDGAAIRCKSRGVMCRKPSVPLRLSFSWKCQGMSWSKRTMLLTDV